MADTEEKQERKPKAARAEASATARCTLRLRTTSATTKASRIASMPLRCATVPPRRRDSSAT